MSEKSLFWWRYFHWIYNSRLSFSSFNTWKILLHCPLTCIIFNDKSIVILFFASLYEKWAIFLRMLLRFFSYHWFYFNFGVVFFKFLETGVCWAFQICGFMVFMKFGKDLAIISSNISLYPSPFLKNPNKHKLGHLTLSDGSLICFISKILCFLCISLLFLQVS